MKKSFSRMLSVLIIMALVTSFGMTALAVGPSVNGAPRMPKGAANLIDLSKVTGDTSNFIYSKDQLICQDPTEDPKTVEFAVNNGSITHEATYVVSMWAKLSEDAEDWIGFEIVTNDNGTTMQSVIVYPNVIYLTENGQTQAQCTNIKAPVGSYFKLDILFRPTDDGRYFRNIFLNNQPVTNDWSGNNPDMPLEAIKPVLRITSKMCMAELSSFRMYLVDENAKEFEDITKPIKTPPKTTTEPAVTTTEAVSGNTTNAVSDNMTTQSVADATNMLASGTIAITTSNTLVQSDGGFNIWMIVIIISVAVLAGGGIAIALILKSPTKPDPKTDEADDKAE